jgi:hypothetical protein
MMVWAQDRALNIALFPQVEFGKNSTLWWQTGTKDANWWHSWFDQYRNFLLHHTDLAAQVKAGALILGDPGILPILTNDRAKEVFPEARWQDLIKEIRARYSGKILWAVSYPLAATALPAISAQCDGYYLLWNAASAKTSNSTSAEMAAEIGKMLDKDILPLKGKNGKMIVLGAKLPAITGTARGCGQIGNECKPFSFEEGGLPANAQINLQEQAVMYDALLFSINQRTWIDGFVSRGFYPVVQTQDGAASTHGKPAAQVLWYYFQKMVQSP